MSDAAHPHRDLVRHSIDSRGARSATSNGLTDAISYAEPGERTAAVVSAADERNGVRIIVFYSSRGGKPLSLIRLKQYCADCLPLTHIPDNFVVLEKLPKTGTGKTNYRILPLAWACVRHALLKRLAGAIARVAEFIALAKRSCR